MGWDGIRSIYQEYLADFAACRMRIDSCHPVFEIDQLLFDETIGYGMRDPLATVVDEGEFIVTQYRN